MNSSSDSLRSEACEIVRRYYRKAFKEPEFKPGKTPIPCAGRVFDDQEMVNLVNASLDFWLTTGRFAAEFEKGFARFHGGRHAILVNSGSSANLLAVTCLTAPELSERRLAPGDEIITTATGFPTTVNPVIQNRFVPVFVDVCMPTYNVDVSQLETALSSRTRAVMLAHTLGNPFNADAVTAFCKRHNLWLIEDCCDALGSTYKGRKAGTFGQLATVSFYPAHHITMGEGGCVLAGMPLLRTLVESFRDWGRACWCEPGHDNTCGKRYEWQFGELPRGYDHKYIYSRIGYNLKLTDMQAAIGCAQLKKLPAFIEARRRNFRRLYDGVKDLEPFFVLPEATLHSKPSWFGFPLSIRPNAPFKREKLLRHLQARKIGARLLFGGNLVRQPAYKGVRHRTIGRLPNSDFVMTQAFWLGVYPGLSDAMIDYVIETLHRFCRSEDAF